MKAGDDPDVTLSTPLTTWGSDAWEVPISAALLIAQSIAPLRLSPMPSSASFGLSLFHIRRDPVHASDLTVQSPCFQETAVIY